MQSNTIVLDSLVIARDGAPLTQPISQVIQGGEMLSISGRNGSGKSTFLKTLAGLMPVYQGSIRVNGEWPSPLRPLYLGHKRGLTPSMSVKDNVAFWGKASGYPELIDAAMHYFDLSDIPDVTVSTLSAGWQQRVALTRLITIPSGLWLLDEPTENLDADGAGLLQSLMQTRMEQGGIILAASHIEMRGDKIKQLELSLIDYDFDQAFEEVA